MRSFWDKYCGRIENHSTVIKDNYVLQYYLDYPQYKSLQREIINPFFSPCKIREWNDGFLIRVKKYEVIETLTGVDYHIDYILSLCLLLQDNKYQFTIKELQARIDSILSQVRSENLYNALDVVFKMSETKNHLLDNYDFRIDNILWDRDKNQYILWDVVCT